MQSTREISPVSSSAPSVRGPSGPAADTLRRRVRRLVAAADRRAAQALLAALGDAPLVLVLPDGDELRSGEGEATARIAFREPGTLLALLGPRRDVVFGDGYAEGRIGIEGDLTGFLERTWGARSPHPLVEGAYTAWRRLTRSRNSIRAARDHVHHHYDLGNDFYALWLDQEMVYTCAYFPAPDATLEVAQRAKMELVARKLRLRPGDRVVEAGCGWGALALHLARRHGARVRAFNVSAEQIAWARDRARREGLASRVEFVEDDYRNVSTACDAFVSVGMLEHVGPARYGDLSRVIDRVLAPDGRGLLHFIGRNRRTEFSPWVERRIFPGAHAPSLREAMAVLEPADLSVLDVENLRLHYARTLEHWLARFESHADAVRRRFDERFVRTWRLYLAGSVAGFRAGGLQLFQIVFARGRSNAVPWSRADLHAGPLEG